MKKIAFVNELADLDWERAIRDNMEEVLGGYVDIANYSFDRLAPGDQIQADLIIVMRQNRVASLKNHVREARRIMVLTRTIRQYALNQIFSIPAGTTVLVVNDSRNDTLETVGLLMQLDINHIHFAPYVKGMDCSPFRIAITPGESALVPKGIEAIIDVGHRCIDISSFIEIMRRLEITGYEIDKNLLNYSDKIITLDYGVNYQYKDLFLKNVQLNAVINLSHEGVLLVNPQKMIVLYNRTLATMLGLSQEIMGAPEWVLAPEIRAVLEQKNGQEWLLDYKGHSLVVTRQTIENFGDPTGYCYNFQEVSYLRQLEQNLSRKLQENGLTARYTFTDVQTESPRMKRCIELAKKISHSDLTALIIGESGTGKELLAQSIHNLSSRNRFPFVAVNCAAMPENLLESELFGYEGGTFTGALKEGKTGLFEQANNGTIFLDELADMPYMLQAKLLRVLQERQIMRLGSQRVLNVNIRVIAATNKDLRQHMLAGHFRKDLYYRLNAVTLKVPPLRDRREDILLLIHRVLSQQDQGSLTFTPDAEAILMNYSWPGNVRELKNVANYLAFMSPSRVTVTDLPHDLLAEKLENFTREEQMIEAQCGLGRAHAILAALLDFAIRNRGAGRKSLEETLESQGHACSEAEVRSALRTLNQTGFVHSKPGRNGSTLTSRGHLFLEWLADRRTLMSAGSGPGR